MAVLLLTFPIFLAMCFITPWLIRKKYPGATCPECHGNGKKSDVWINACGTDEVGGCPLCGRIKK